MSVTPSKPPVGRFPFPDFLRGLTIIMMAVFHTGFDLAWLGIYPLPVLTHWFWLTLQTLIMVFFMLSVGMSLWIRHHDQVDWPAFARRFLRIAAAAGSISLGSWLLFPAYWVYFGALHCIAVSSVLGLGFLRAPRAALLVGAALTIGYFVWGFDLWGAIGVDRIFHKPHDHALDYVPLYPWFGFVLVGIFLGSIGAQRLDIRIPGVSAGLRWLGRHALAAYLIHLPLIYGILSVGKRLF